MRILIVDDDCDTADLFQMLLRAAGHDVRVAYRGDDAVAVATAFEPELALIDLGLPDTTGFQLARQIRKLSTHRMQMVAVTGREDRNLPLAGSFEQHARKPVTAARLYQVIDAARDALRERI